jgi:histidinol dehydrogenase
MKVIKGYKEARKLLERSMPYDMSSGGYDKIEAAVKEIILAVKNEGDRALYRYTERFDGARLKCLEVPPNEIAAARRSADKELVKALKFAAVRVERFHRTCMKKFGTGFLKDGLGQQVLPLERVGIYVPGGTAAYPSTVLMTAIPARVAGVREIIMVTPCGKDGKVPVNTLAAASIARVDRIFKIGGAQAVAALAFGTKSVPRVDKICGPGNIYVMTAKKLVYGTVAIDALQGPSEVVVIADSSADPAFCAADLIAQSEHDNMASSVFITTSDALAHKVQAQINEQMRGLKRNKIAAEALSTNGRIVIVRNLDEALELANLYAPEHLSLMVSKPSAYIGRIRNAGCICAGEYSPVVLGDYVAGPSHALPTGGSARFSSPLIVQDFIKISSIISFEKDEINQLGPVAITIAENEGLSGHARAVKIRLKKKGGKDA